MFKCDQHNMRRRSIFSYISEQIHSQETFGAMAKTEKIAFILEQVRG